MKPRAQIERFCLLAVCTLALGLGCQIVVDTEGLSDRDCPADEKPCDDLKACVSRMSPTTGCGHHSCLPCVVPHAFAECTTDFRCQKADCHPDYDSCNGDDEDGCEVDLRHDPNNCGSCGHRCPEVPNGYRACSAGICSLGGCHLGYEDCDGEYSTGCECPPGMTCQQGICGEG